MMAGSAEGQTVREPAWRRVNKALAWSVAGLIPVGIFAAAILPDDSVAWGALAPVSFLCFLGWLAAGIAMLISWHQRLTRAGDGGAQRGRSVRARAWVARAGLFGLFGLLLPAAFTVAAIPGNTTVGVVVTYAAIIFGTFWLAGAGYVVVSRIGRAKTRPS